MGKHPFIKFSVWFVLIVVFAVSPAMAQSQDNLEQRVKQLEQQLEELKGLLEEKKAAEAEEEAIEEAHEEIPEMKLLGTGSLKVGGDIRWRGLYFDNVWDFNDDGFNDERSVFRFRPRVYFDWLPTDNFEAYVRFTKEWFWGEDNEHYGYNVEAKDAAFDNAWGEVKDIFGSGVNLRVGRQDLIYGEGLVMLDGTPYDGSQTIAFDAVKLNWNHELGSTDLLYSKVQENNFQASDDEDLYGIYNKLLIEDWGLNLEPYFLTRNKNDAADTSGHPGNKDYPYPPYDPSPKEQTYLIGMRTTTSYGDSVKLDLAAEGGYEWGNMDLTGVPTYANDPANGFNHEGTTNVDRDAWGGYVHGTVTLEDVLWKPSFKTAFSYFSGDDPSTEDYEGWDDFYGQWPKYSELYIYSLYDGFKFANQHNDPDLGAWSNMMIPEAMITVKPTKQLTQSLRYLYYYADEDVGPGTGKERGHNLQWLTYYVFNENISTHFLAEWFDPGDYYLDGADDAFFVRFQLMYKF